MTTGAASSRWKLLAVGATVLAIACGGDDDKGTGTPPGNTQTMNPTTGVRLGAGVAGKACTTDTECGPGGSCATKQTFGVVTALLEGLGLPSTVNAAGGYCTRTCTVTADCGEGSVCFGGLGALSPGECRKTCAANTDCRGPEYECAKPPAQPLPVDAGAPRGPGVGGILPPTCQALFPADKLADNQTGLACNPDDAAAAAATCGDGLCAGGACSGLCNVDSDCGANGACFPLIYGSLGLCQETCAVDQDCAGFAAGGVGCIDSNARKVCGPKIFPLAPGLVGKACAQNSECGTGECATTLGLQALPAPGGYCSLRGCQDDTLCGGGSCISSIGGTRCYDSCAADSECRTGYTCQERTTAAMAQVKVCAPPPPVRDGGTPAPTSPTDAGSTPVVPVTPDAGTPVSTTPDAG